MPRKPKQRKGFKAPKAANTKRKGDRLYLVSVASNVGGGRIFLWARDPEEAASDAMARKLTKTRKGLRGKSVSVIVTDISSKGRNRQTFF